MPVLHSWAGPSSRLAAGYLLVPKAAQGAGVQADVLDSLSPFLAAQDQAKVALAMLLAEHLCWSSALCPTDLEHTWLVQVSQH